MTRVAKRSRKTVRAAAAPRPSSRLDEMTRVALSLAREYAATFDTVQSDRARNGGQVTAAQSLEVLEISERVMLHALHMGRALRREGLGGHRAR